MAGQNPIAHCLERLFLADDTVLAEKAEHFQGLCSTRVPSKVFGKGPNSKPVISIHLAYENLGRHDWDSKLAAELAGCKPAVYDTAVSLTRKHLGIVPVVSFESLTVALGCTTMIKQVESLWDSFQESYLGNLSVAKKLSAKEELSQPVWKGAIVYACAKALGESVTKAPLQSLCSCSLPELTKCIKVVTDVAKKAIEELKSQSTKASRTPRTTGKRRIGEDEDVVEETPAAKKVKMPGTKKALFGRLKRTDSKQAPATKEYKPISGIVSMINRQDYRQTRRYRDYIQWKDSLIARLSNSTTTIE